MFDPSAEPGEWAVTGTFMFADDDPSMHEGKTRAAFRGGFLGVQSLGWSTLVQIVDAAERDYFDAVHTLAGHLVEKFGAPTFNDAEIAAEAELTFANSLCSHPVDTLIAMHRSHDGGEIRETFRSLRPKDGPRRMRAFAFLDGEGGQKPVERVDLAALATRQARQVI